MSEVIEVRGENINGEYTTTKMLFEENNNIGPLFESVLKGSILLGYKFKFYSGVTYHSFIFEKDDVPFFEVYFLTYDKDIHKQQDGVFIVRQVKTINYVTEEILSEYAHNSKNILTRLFESM